MTNPLAGYTIGVTADRRSDEQMKLLSGRGAECLHGPVIKTHPVGTDDAMRDATEAILDEPPDAIVLTTGLGVRSWLEAADAVQLGDRLHDLLASTALYARGPKANGALVTAGFDVEWTAPNARYDDIIDELTERGADGMRIAVQLDGAGAAGLCERIEALGATVVRIPVYRWSLPADTTTPSASSGRRSTGGSTRSRSPPSRPSTTSSSSPPTSARSTTSTTPSTPMW